MALLLVYAVERSALFANAPAAPQVEAAFTRARLGPRPEDGGWIGPRARVTRTAVVGESFQTRVAWLYGWPAGGPWLPRAPLAELAAILRDRVAAELAALGGSWDVVTSSAWAENVNGPLAWWASGEASNTRTREEFPTGAGRLDATENPVGPTTDATHPTSPGGAAGGLGGAVAGAAPWVLGAAVAAGVGWLWWHARGARAVAGVLGGFGGARGAP